ncbi:Uncharacterised protein [Plesiomonas shigelloides]|nr:Uncharacterised protein [Plesiomonas shigelloides]
MTMMVAMTMFMSMPVPMIMVMNMRMMLSVCIPFNPDFAFGATACRTHGYSTSIS